jgi:hypothetical protein
MGKRFDPLTLNNYMNAEPIEVKEKNLDYPAGIIPKYQFRLWDNKMAQQIRGQHYNRAVGVFYEIITAGITGGIWMGLRDSAKGSDVVYKPDVVSPDGIYDAKSVSWNESCKLQDFQMDKGLVQECTGEFLKPRRKIFLPIFKHRLVSPWKEFDKAGLDLENTLISNLCEQTGFCLFLPFQVIYHLYSVDIPAKEYKTRYDGSKWDHETRFLCSGIKKMLINPEVALHSISLNPETFDIRQTHFPNGIKINGNEIKPFPILSINYRNGNYESWLKQISTDKKDEIERIRTEKRTRSDYREGREGPHIVEFDDEIDEGLNFGFNDEKMKREVGISEKPDTSKENYSDVIPF